MGALRNFAAGHFALELDGAFAGWASNIQGGTAVAHALASKVGADPIVRNSATAVRYDDIVVTCGGGMSKTFYDWVADASARKSIMKDGAVIVCDDNLKARRRLDWSAGVITEIGFPAFGATEKGPGIMTIKITPERTVKADDEKVLSASRPSKPWNGGGFRLQIDGFEQATKYVSRVEPITINWQKSYEAQTPRYERLVLGGVQLGDVVITLSTKHAEGFYAWFEKFALQGDTGPGSSKDGLLEFLAPDSKSVHFALAFEDLTPVTLTLPKRGSLVAELGDCQVRMICEEIKFSASA